jgi:hypothetical protein
MPPRSTGDPFRGKIGEARKGNFKGSFVGNVGDLLLRK